MRLSDVIAQFIYDLLSENGSAEIGRNDLAVKFNVVPSQISYVISSRFTPEQGYTVESKRGSGGSVRITKVKRTDRNYLMHIINSVGSSLDCRTARLFLINMTQEGLITAGQARIMAAAVADNPYQGIEIVTRDQIRAEIFKNMLISIATE